MEVCGTILVKERESHNRALSGAIMNKGNQIYAKARTHCFLMVSSFTQEKLNQKGFDINSKSALAWQGKILHTILVE